MRAKSGSVVALFLSFVFAGCANSPSISEGTSSGQSKPSGSLTTSQPVGVASYPSAKSEPIAFCRQAAAFFAVGDSGDMETLFARSASNARGVEAAAQMRKMVDGYAGVIRYLTKDEKPALTQVNESSSKQGYSTVIQTWKGGNGPEFYIGCMIHRSAEGLNQVDLYLNTDLQALRQKLDERRRPLSMPSKETEI